MIWLSFGRTLLECFPVRLSIDDVHFAVAVGAKSDGILNRVLAALCEPRDVVALEVRLVLLVMEWRRLFAEVARAVRQPLDIFGNGRVSHICGLLCHSYGRLLRLPPVRAALLG